MASAQHSLSASVGFRHVIEDGILILSKRNGLSVDRKKFVLKDLVGLLGEATRGSEVANQNSLLISAIDRNALKTFSFLHRWLNRDDQQIQEKLKKAEAAFKVIATNAEPSQEDQAIAIELLTELLAGMERRGISEIPEQPAQIRI